MRRMMWMAAGAVVTTVGRRWTRRKAAAVAEHLAPGTVGRKVLDGVGRRVDAARKDGRAAMADTEQRLRARLR